DQPIEDAPIVGSSAPLPFGDDVLVQEKLCELPQYRAALFHHPLACRIGALCNGTKGLSRDRSRLIRSELPNRPNGDPSCRSTATGARAILQHVGLRSGWLHPETEASEIGVPAEVLPLVRPETIDETLGDTRPTHGHSDTDPVLGRKEP